jgi:hypothetical protein
LTGDGKGSKVKGEWLSKVSRIEKAKKRKRKVKNESKGQKNLKIGDWAQR